jgi:hypothetical protein
MPIPLNVLEENVSVRRASLRIAGAAAGTRNAYLFSRMVAHLVDACVVEGLSVYSSKLFSVILMSLHVRMIRQSNHSRAVFLDMFSYSSTELFAAALAAMSFVYFVAVPFVTGRTLGLGLFGMQICSEDGAKPSWQQLTWRLVGVAITYASAGALCVIGFRQRDGKFLHDKVSRTKMVQ